MKIAIDLDKTVFYCNSLAYFIANKFFQHENELRFKFSPIKEVKRQSNGLINRILQSTIIPCNYRKYKKVEGSIEAINELLQDGHELCFLSKRPNIEIFNNIVYKWFEEYDLPVDNVFLNCSNKVEYCKRFGVDILIDDSQKTCELAKKSNIKAYLFDDKEKDCWRKIVDKIDKIVEKQNQTTEKSLANNDLL